MATESGSKNGISVYVVNLGKYNEGELVSDWITLPVPQVELDRFLSEKVGLELDPQAAFEKGMRGERVYEEYGILDFDFDKGLKALNYRPKMCPNLGDINLLAACLVRLNDSALEAVKLCAEQNIFDSDPLKFANLAVQADEIPFYSYCFDGIGYAGSWSDEEKLGYTLLEGSPAKAAMEEMEIFDYFDVERYGQAASHNCTLGDNGYLDCCGDFPDLEFYDRDELKDLVAFQMGNEDYFKSAKELSLAQEPDRQIGLSQRQEATKNQVSQDAAGGKDEPVKDAVSQDGTTL